MGLALIEKVACASLCLSAVTVHAYSDLETVVLNRALGQFEHRILGPAKNYGSPPWTSHGKENAFTEFVAPESEAEHSPVRGSGRKLLLDQVTTSVIETSPVNSTTQTREIGAICSQIISAPHLCETGPWAIPGGAKARSNVSARLCAVRRH